MTSSPKLLFHGALAGAAGTTALNAATYLDMALRARPASSTPEQTVERGAELVGLAFPKDEAQKQAVESGLGSLLGSFVGALRGFAGRPKAPPVRIAWVLAMLAGNGPMTVLGVTDPRTWRPVDWAADIIPHLAYAVVAAAALDAFETPR